MTVLIKEELLRLLKEDQEFRYAVAGLIGYKEILERIDNNTAAIKALQEQVTEHSKDIKALQSQVAELGRALVALGARWGLLSERR